jgi:hypothetical protein
MKFKMMRSSSDNCLQVCLASIFDLEIDDVPNFNNVSSNEWISLMNDFLEDFGYYALIVSAMTDLGELTPIRGIHLMLGEANHNGIYHAVIGEDGKMIHDPSPNASGLREIDVHVVLIPLNPGKMKGM